MKIQIDPTKRFDLSAPCFDDMRRDLSITIDRILPRMRDKRMNAASIALKIDIVTDETVVKDNNAPMGERPALIPDISYKLSVTMQTKGETKGDIVSAKSDKELLMDDIGRYYLVSKEEASGQLSMFNSYDEYTEANGGTQHAEV